MSLAQRATALAGTGQYDEAATTAREAEQLARMITDASEQADTFIRCAQALLVTRQPEQAAVAARQAEHAVRSTASRLREANALLRVADALADAGRYEDAAAAALDAERIARTHITDPHRESDILIRLVEVLARTGNPHNAETVAQAVHYGRRDVAVNRMIRALVGSGKRQQGLTVAENLTEPKLRANALVLAAEILIETGQTEHAATAAERAEMAVRAIVDESAGKRMTRVAVALARAGLFQRAKAVVNDIADSFSLMECLAEASMAFAETRQFDEAEDMAQRIAVPSWAAKAWARLAAAKVTLHREDAWRIADSISDSFHKAAAMAAIAVSLAGAGQDRHAVAAARKAGELARFLLDPSEKGRVLARVAEALAISGHHHEAATAADTVLEVAAYIPRKAPGDTRATCRKSPNRWHAPGKPSKPRG